jgi:hypothetical protein
VTRLFKRYTRLSNFAGECNKSLRYVLWRIHGEAVALAAMRPDDCWLRTQACIICGYVELFDDYRAQEFPWGHVVEKLVQMRGIIVRAERAARPPPRRGLLPSNASP